MSRYITYKEIDGEGKSQYFILQKDFPHIVGLIANYPTKNFVSAMPIVGYNLYIVFNGTLRGSVIPTYKDIDIEITNILQEMSDWYQINRISLFPKRYKKLKYKNDTSPSEQNNSLS
jgi:hypothetical protein